MCSVKSYKYLKCSLLALTLTQPHNHFAARSLPVNDTLFEVAHNSAASDVAIHYCCCNDNDNGDDHRGDNDDSGDDNAADAGNNNHDNDEYY